MVGVYLGSVRGLVVRAGHLDDDARLTLVHELTHALDDQVFHAVGSPHGSDEDESALAYSALLEGDAVRVEEDWGHAQPPEVQDGLRDDGLLDPYEPSSDPVEDTQDFPYWAGPTYVRALLQAGGQPALDEAFQNPVRTTAQVLHPERTDPGRLVQLPEGLPDGAAVVDHGVLGELGLAHLLGTSPVLGGPQTAWQGDAYRTVRSDAGTCTYDDVTVDTAAHLEALRLALVGRADVTLTGSTSLRLRACAQSSGS